MQYLGPQAKSNLVKLGVVGLLLLFVIQAVVSMRQKSVTVDELMYFTIGYYHLKTGDLQNTIHPPLMKVLSALPLLALDLELPSGEEYSDHSNINRASLLEQWKYSRSFLYNNRVDADQILFTARLAIVVVAVGLGLYLFLWSRELYGDIAGLFALFLYCFSPNILANSGMVIHDLGLTAFSFIATFYFWKYASHPAAKWLVLCGVFFGLAMLTKTAALFLIPIWTVYALLCILRRNGLGIYRRLPVVGRMTQRGIRLQQFTSFTFSLVLIALVGLVTLNLGYGFQGSFQPVKEEYQSAIRQRVPQNYAAVTEAVDFLLSAPVPLPAAYVDILADQFRVSGTKAVYFAGKVYDSGLWYVTLAAFFLKTPIPTLILLAISIAFLIIQPKGVEAELLAVIFIAVFLAVFSYMRIFNAAVRYILPAFPFIFLLASRLISLDLKNRRLAYGSLVALAVWYLVGTIAVFPHYLAYFNELIGGPKNGYKYLVDSNLDWGQDLKGLKQYMEEKGIDRIKLAYFGSADAAYYGINYDYLPSVGLAPTEPGQYWWYEMDSPEKAQLEPQTGIIAVSATLLASPGWMGPLFGDAYEWLKEYEPVDQVGHSILIYDIR
jgi:4-amino-4-deoxy-L-arabinose transferase-like glycosyltransferase